MPPQLAVLGIWQNTQQDVINVGGFFHAHGWKMCGKGGKWSYFWMIATLTLKRGASKVNISLGLLLSIYYSLNVPWVYVGEWSHVIKVWSSEKSIYFIVSYVLDGTPRRIYSLAEVVEKEYCHARKVSKRNSHSKDWYCFDY